MKSAKTLNKVMDFEAARSYAEKRLREELSKTLYYHSFEHTLDVCNAASRLAELQGIDETDTMLLLTAAWFHDIGFLEQYKDNEPIAAQLAGKVLPRFNYSDEQIQIVQGCILATRLPQTPNTLLEKLMCDADLDYLGRDDFYSIALNLRREWFENGIYTFSLKSWYELQLKFMLEHQYHTKVALQLREEKKQIHIRELNELLGFPLSKTE